MNEKLTKISVQTLMTFLRSVQQLQVKIPIWNFYNPVMSDTITHLTMHSLLLQIAWNVVWSLEVVWFCNFQLWNVVLRRVIFCVKPIYNYEHIARWLITVWIWVEARYIYGYIFGTIAGWKKNFCGWKYTKTNSWLTPLMNLFTFWLS